MTTIDRCPQWCDDAHPPEVSTHATFPYVLDCDDDTGTVDVWASEDEDGVARVHLGARVLTCEQARALGDALRTLANLVRPPT